MKSLCSAKLIIGVLCALAACTLQAQTVWNPYTANPVLTGGALDPSVLFDTTSHTYTMWFVRPGNGVWKATSTDGIAWSIDNSIALVPGQPGSYDYLIYSVSVVKRATTYYMYYTSSRGGDTLSISMAVSADGIHWAKNPASPVLRPAAGAWDSIRNTGARVVVVNLNFMMLYSGSAGPYTDLGLATSADGVVWVKSPSNPLLVHGGPSSVDAIEVGSAGVAFDDRSYFLIYRATDAFGRETYCLATSADGTQWHKYAGNPIYPAPRPGWDSQQIGGGSLLWMNDAFKFWYCGTSGSSWSIGLSVLSQNFKITPTALDFGWVRIGSADSLSIMITNAETDSLRITQVKSNNAVFGVSPQSVTIQPGGSYTLRVAYAPQAAALDTGLIGFYRNGSSTPQIQARVTGRGFALSEKPVISKALLVPNTYYQVRINWIRSSRDTAGAIDQAFQYSIWREVPGTNYSSSDSPAATELRPISSLIGPMWEFLQAIPAVGFEQYSAVVPAYVDRGAQSTSNLFVVAAQTKGLQVFTSTPDTVKISSTAVSAVDDREPGVSPEAISLEQNYPNPFNPSTIIRFALPDRSMVTLIVYNILGQPVATLIDGMTEAGHHEVRFDAVHLSSGVYFYRMSAGTRVETKRLLLVR